MEWMGLEWVKVPGNGSVREEVLQIYNSLHEKQLKHIYEPEPGLFICESRKVVGRALDAGYEPESLLIEEGRESLLEGLRLPEGCVVYQASGDVMRELAGYRLTGGLLAAMRRRRLPELPMVCRGARRIAVLDDIENPTNVGAIFRSAAAMGMDAVLLTKGCSDPLYRRCARVSMGTVFQIPWTYADIPDLRRMRETGVLFVALALEDGADSIDAARIKAAEKAALVLGNEDCGISQEVRGICDMAAKIPMASGVDSLNVAAASAVAFWETGKGMSG